MRGVAPGGLGVDRAGAAVIRLRLDAYTAETCRCGKHWRLLRVVDLVLAFRAGRR